MSTAVLPRPDVVPPRPWTFPASRTLVLPNGLTVVGYHLPGKKIAALTLLLDLGQETEPEALEGLASITMSALDEGTASYDSQGFAAARNRIGGKYGAGCDSNVGSVSLSLPVSKLAPALDLLAEAALRPTFPAGEVDRLVKQRLDGLANELANPSSRANVELAKAWYTASSRRSKPGGGTADSVGRIDRNAVEAFYREQADPATSTLIVAGDLSGVALGDVAAARFGEWVSRGRTRVPVPAAALYGASRFVVVDRPGSVQTQLLLAAPSVGKAHPDLPAARVAAYALGGGMDSRIMAVLREEKGYTYGISAQAQTERADGRLVVSGAVQTEVTGPAVEELMAILRDYASGGIREDERVAAVEALAGRAPLQYETPQAVASTASSLLANGLPDDYIDRQNAALRATTVEGINAAIARSVALDQPVLVAVGDGSVITEPLRAAGLGDVTVVPV